MKFIKISLLITCRSICVIFAQKPRPKGRFQSGLSEIHPPNGLEVIFHIDRSDPVVAVSLTAHVGSAREKAGRTGFAHMFEHLLFLESENLGKGGLDKMSAQIGGSGANGSTSRDRTNYSRRCRKTRWKRCSGPRPKARLVHQYRHRSGPGEGKAGRKEREAAEVRQQPLRPHSVRDRQGAVSGGPSLQLAGDRLARRSAERDAGGRKGIFPPLVCSEQRDAGRGRRFRSRPGEEMGREIFQRDQARRGHHADAEKARAWSKRRSSFITRTISPACPR